MVTLRWMARYDHVTGSIWPFSKKSPLAPQSDDEVAKRI
jgi:hypothetical protein